MIKPEQVELMAPVGSYESLAAAINSGADSIYFGVTQLNMRAKSADNMTLEDLKKVADICHQNNVKCYLTVNTLIYEHDLKIMKKIVDAAKANGIDAIIASDFAVIQYCKEIGMSVHISTQLSISNYETVKFFAQYTNRVVLARELTLEQIKEIYKKIHEEKLIGVEGKIMEIECFVHGALCVAQSGRCYMSLYTYNSSANRGACKQNCRAKYKVTDVESGKELIIDNHYVMSAADICTIDMIDQLLDAGIQVFKIEGRGRSPEYVSTVIGAYRKAIDDLRNGNYTKERIEQYFEELKTVFNRGLSHGNYYLGKEIGAYSTAGGNEATKEKEYVGQVTHIFPKSGVIEVKVEDRTLNLNDDIYIIGSETGALKAKVTELRKDDAQIQNAVKGDVISLPLTEKVKMHDKVYRIKDKVAKQQYGD